MAYDRPANLASGATVTEAWVDAVTNSFEAGFPDICTTAGDMVYATAADTGARLALGTAPGRLAVGSSAPAWQIVPSCRVYNSGNIDPATSTWVTLTFDSERFDHHTMHDTSSNTGRITIPSNGDGVYIIGACAKFDLSGLSSGEEDIGLRILLGGSTVIAEHYFIASHDDVDSAITITTIYELAATNYVEVQGYTSSDVDIVQEGNLSPVFWASYLARGS